MRKLGWMLCIAWCGGIGARSDEAAPGGGAWVPLPVPVERSAETARRAKPVLESSLLDGMESMAGWTNFGPGQAGITEERAFESRRSLRLTSPTKLGQPGPVSGRPFAETGVRRTFDGENWESFNRLSFRVYPHLPGFRTISMLVRLRAEGSGSWLYTFGHLHYVLLQPDRWNHVVWEIPHLPRARVTGIELVYRLQGHEPGATETVLFDFDDLRLERVAAPDPWRGWEVAPGRIAYCHLGYRTDAAKVAVGALADGTEFAVERVAVRGDVPGTGARGATVGGEAFRGTAALVTNALGRFAVLDFSSLREPGWYRLRHGDAVGAPFRVGADVWGEARRATLNHFRCQRCGEPVPGIHESCHRDWQVAHGASRILIEGGWHDAGDLSQGLVNSAEATVALFGMAERLNGARPAEARAFAWEARRGLDWVQRTRFGDGHRLGWATMDFWTDGILGNADDVVVKASDAALDNLVGARASAVGARWFRERDPILARSARLAAVADWRFALGRLDRPNTELAAAAIRTSMALHRMEPRDEYRDRAVEWARGLIEAQQREPEPGWRHPMAGFFFTGRDRRRPLNYPHRGHHEGPVVALAELLDRFPEHSDAQIWRDAVRRHAEFLRATAGFVAPWWVPAAGVYTTRDAGRWDEPQIRQGTELGEGWYLRRFPVWGEMRGNSGVMLSQARALATAARVLSDPGLAALAEGVLEWHLGRNPFCQSLMFGVGEGFAPQYSAMSGDIVGGLPVGIQTRGDEDVPYWPASNCYNYAEIWVHPSARWLEVAGELELFASEAGRGTDQ